jgi:glycerol-3-phosphate dehydrogenase
VFVFFRLTIAWIRIRIETNILESRFTTSNLFVEPSAVSSTLPATDKRRHARLAESCDLLIVGGGINGAGIARDAAGRGLSVVLCEQHDLAAHTSSASTKLIHGGLRYLEHYEFGLVRKALIEREALLRSAPHIMRPLRFVMPHDPSMRPAWMIRLGVWLYDHLARREVLPGSEAIALAGHRAGEPLKSSFTRAFVYSDGWVDDARLVVLNARAAADQGAAVLTRTRVTDARPQEGGGWRVRLRTETGEERELQARALVNAAGPWAMQFLREGLQRARQRGLRLVKGSHIVVPRLFEHEMAYIFQNSDKRIVFAIPYERNFTLVGTTDVEYRGDPAAVHADEDEIAYLCALVNRYFRKAIGPADVVRTYSGVRPLLDDESGDPSAVTRDYQLEFDKAPAPLLSVWGGKITTFRKLAEEAVDLLAPSLGSTAAAWTKNAALPGGDLSATIGAAKRPDLDFAEFLAKKRRALPWLPEPLLERYARQYGALIDRVIGEARSLAELGAELAPGLYEAEARYLVDQEWVRSAEDLAWRRTKLGLHVSEGDLERVDNWIASHPGARSPDLSSYPGLQRR